MRCRREVRDGSLSGGKGTELALEFVLAVEYFVEGGSFSVFFNGGGGPLHSEWKINKYMLYL